MMDELVLLVDVFENDTNADNKGANINVNIESKHVNRNKRKDRKAAAIARRNERISKQPPANYFIGKHKWLGGAVDPETGIIYGVPSNSIEVICIHPPPPVGRTELDEMDGNVDKPSAFISTIQLPNEYKEGYFKWLRGIITNGFLYGIPAWSTNGVLKVRLQKKGKGPRVRLLPLPNPPPPLDEKLNKKSTIRRANDRDQHNVNPSAVRRDKWMWHGAGLSQTSHPAIYCIPSNAERVLKVDVLTDAVTEIGPAFKEGQNKWYGGIKGKDGCIYGMPYTASGVLRVDPTTDDVQVLGNFPVGGWKWHGGLMSPANGVIYAFPAHSNEVLCVDTNIRQGEDQNWRVSTVPIQKHPNDKDPDDLRYKWLGGAYGADGCIYGMPSDATSILRIEPHEQANQTVATTFGNVNIPNTSAVNKWQGGVLSPMDGCVYAVPADANCVLKIDTNPDTPLDIDFIDLNLHRGVWPPNNNYTDIEDKWQGGFMGRDGVIYGIPECVDRVMKLTPGKDARVDFIQ